MLNIKLQEKELCSEIRKGTKITDTIEYLLKQRMEMGWTYSSKNEGKDG